jgi:hypothetical protein
LECGSSQGSIVEQVPERKTPAGAGAIVERIERAL